MLLKNIQKDRNLGQGHSEWEGVRSGKIGHSNNVAG